VRRVADPLTRAGAVGADCMRLYVSRLGRREEDVAPRRRRAWLIHSRTGARPDLYRALPEDEERAAAGRAVTTP
jgi:hypothetical protein